ncbi:MAG: hypothetical protein RL141_414 [Candidatus Parcubacteria bacterium]|jgi:hypothetical protein
MEKLRIAVSMLLSIAFINGCGSAPSQNKNQRDQDIEITQQTENDLRVVVTDDHAQVSIVIHRRGLREAEAIKDAEIDSPFDSDLIVRNRFGYPFVSSGNHASPTDPDTGTRSLEPEIAFDQSEQIEDLHLAMETIEHLQSQPDTGEEYRWELRTLYFMLDRTISGANDMINGNIVPEETPSLDEIPPELLVPGSTPSPQPSMDADEQPSDANGFGMIRQGFTAPYNHRVGIFYDPIYWIFGHHSAVFLEVYDSQGVFVASVSTRNHGREATDPTMRNVGGGCPRTFTGRSIALPPMQPHITTDLFSKGDAGGCGTPYDAIFPTSGGHVCNDDTAAEYWNIKFNSASSWVTCGDSTLRQFAPTCD